MSLWIKQNKQGPAEITVATLSDYRPLSDQRFSKCLEVLAAWVVISCNMGRCSSMSRQIGTTRIAIKLFHSIWIPSTYLFVLKRAANPSGLAEGSRYRWTSSTILLALSFVCQLTHNHSARPSIKTLPVGSSPCRLPTYLKLGLGSFMPELLEISRPHSFVPFALLPMLNIWEICEHPARLVNSRMCSSCIYFAYVTTGLFGQIFQRNIRQSQSASVSWRELGLSILL